MPYTNYSISGTLSKKLINYFDFYKVELKPYQQPQLGGHVLQKMTEAIVIRLLLSDHHLNQVELDLGSSRLDQAKLQVGCLSCLRQELCVVPKIAGFKPKCQTPNPVQISCPSARSRATCNGCLALAPTLDGMGMITDIS